MSDSESAASSESEVGSAPEIVALSTAFTGLDKEDFYHGLLPEEDALRLLQRNGDFLVRVGDAGDGSGRQVWISVRWTDQGFSFPVLVSPKGCTIDGSHFAEYAGDLIRLHRSQCVPVAAQGVLPLNAVLRQEWEIRHDQITQTQKLGEGAFGEVHLGFLQVTNVKKLRVAIKLSKGEVNKEQIEEMMREARLMRLYKHPNIVRFYGVAAEKDPVMIIMEFVGGGALDSYLKKGIGSITPKQKAGMCYDVACGLAYLHEHGCIHRDIAARNCLVSTKNHRVKLSDFGLSTKNKKHVIDRNEKAPIRWLAPEVISTLLYEQPADIWSYGVLSWEIFADGEIPYKEFSTADLRRRIHEPDFRLVMRADTPQDVAQIVATCWTANPQSRSPMCAIAAGLRKYSPEETEKAKLKKKEKKEKKAVVQPMTRKKSSKPKSLKAKKKTTKDARESRLRRDSGSRSPSSRRKTKHKKRSPTPSKDGNTTSTSSYTSRSGKPRKSRMG